MTASPCRRRPRHLSPAAAPLEDEDLLAEILLRLPPLPSSLPRASLVCKRWRCILSDPRFRRRFRLHHRRSPPLLGFICRQLNTFHVEIALEPPNRVPAGRFSSLQLDAGGRERFMLLDCRHGLVLISYASRDQVLVWDPVTGDQHRVAAPPGLDRQKTRISWAVLRAAGEIHHFHLVVVGNDEKKITRALACVYSSETGAWGNFISTPLPSVSASGYPAMVIREKPAVMVGESIYWLFSESISILEFDLRRQSLAVITVAVNRYSPCFYSVVQAKGGGLGFLILPNFLHEKLRPDSHAQLWKRKTECDGVASWVRERTIELYKPLSMNSEQGRAPLTIAGSAEFNNVVFLWTINGIFMVDLQSLQFKRLFEIGGWAYRHPFESVYIPETGIGDGHNGPGL